MQSIPLAPITIIDRQNTGMLHDGGSILPFESYAATMRWLIGKLPSNALAPHLNPAYIVDLVRMRSLQNWDIEDVNDLFQLVDTELTRRTTARIKGAK